MLEYGVKLVAQKYRPSTPAINSYKERAFQNNICSPKHITEESICNQDLVVHSIGSGICNKRNLAYTSQKIDG